MLFFMFSGNSLHFALILACLCLSYFCALACVQNGCTALMQAVMGSSAEIVELLLKAGSDVEIKSRVSADIVSSQTVFNLL